MNKKPGQLVKLIFSALLIFQLAACGDDTPDSGNGGGESVTLNWQIPAKNTNGSILDDLAGYKIYYGTSPLVTKNVITVTNPGASSHVVSGLSSGVTYYFVITAVNNQGVESSYSNTTSKVL